MAISINTKSKAVIAKAVAVLKNVIKTAKTTCGIIARKAIASTNLTANMINSFISSPLFRYYNTQVTNVNIDLDKIKTPSFSPYTNNNGAVVRNLVYEQSAVHSRQHELMYYSTLAIFFTDIIIAYFMLK